MKNLLIVLSAAVIAGLAVYFAFNAFDAIELRAGDVSMHVNGFVLLIACLSLAAAAVSLLLRALIVRTDKEQVHALEQRIAQLEQRTPTGV